MTRRRTPDEMVEASIEGAPGAMVIIVSGPSGVGKDTVISSLCLVPAEAQRWIDDLGALRLAGLFILALIELWVLVEIVKILFGREPSVERVVARSGAPAWVARLMLLEARFWKWVWRRLRGR